MLSFLFVYSSSKIEAGQLSLHFHSHNVCDVVESAAMLCYELAVSKGLELSWFVDPSLPPALLLDATRLQQVRASSFFFPLSLSSR